MVRDDGRETLKAIGIRGELVETPGHSPDSVSLALDAGLAFVGDLHLPDQVDAGSYDAVAGSWRKLIDLNVHTVYPGHAQPFQMERVAALLSPR